MKKSKKSIKKLLKIHHVSANELAKSLEGFSLDQIYDFLFKNTMEKEKYFENIESIKNDLIKTGLVNENIFSKNKTKNDSFVGNDEYFTHELKTIINDPKYLMNEAESIKNIISDVLKEEGISIDDDLLNKNTDMLVKHLRTPKVINLLGEIWAVESEKVQIKNDFKKLNEDLFNTFGLKLDEEFLEDKPKKGPHKL